METTDTITYEIRGDLLSTNADAVRAEIDKLLPVGKSAKVVQLDLRASRLIDSVGLNLIVSVIRRVKRRGGQTRITVGHPTVRRMMTFTRIDQHAEVVMA